MNKHNKVNVYSVSDDIDQQIKSETRVNYLVKNEDSNEPSTEEHKER